MTDVDNDITVSMTGSSKGSPPPITHPEVDLAERDPRNVSGYITINFQEIIGEPESSAFSFDKVWIYSFKVFTVTKIWGYRIITALLALPVAAICGINFACLNFCCVWLCNPVVRCAQIQCHVIRQMWHMVLDALIKPFFSALGSCLSSVRITALGD